MAIRKSEDSSNRDKPLEHGHVQQVQPEGKEPGEVMPDDEIQTPRDEYSKRSGEVVYPPEQEAQYQTVDEALKVYDDSTAKVIAAVSTKEPGWLNRALQKSRQAWAASNMAVNTIKQKAEIQRLKHDALTADDKLRVAEFRQQKAAIDSSTAEHENKEFEHKYFGKIKGFIVQLASGIGEALSAMGSGAYYRWKERKTEFKSKKEALEAAKNK